MRFALGFSGLLSLAACNALIDRASDFSLAPSPSCDGGACIDAPTFGPDPAAPWPMVGGNAGHTGFARSEGHQLKKRDRWSDRPVVLPAPPAGEPAVDAEGNAYVVTTNAVLYAYAAEGHVRWSVNLGGTSQGTPALAGSDRLYVTSSSQGLRAFSRDGKELWGEGRARVGRGSPVVAADGRVFVVDDKLHALEPDGEVSWSYDLGGPWSGRDVPPAIDESGVIIVMRDAVHGVSPNGTKLWQSPDGDRLAPMPVVSEGLAYVGVGTAVAAIETREGETRWKAPLGGPRLLTRPAIGKGGLLYLLAGRELSTLSGGEKGGLFNLESVQLDVVRPPAPVLARIGDSEVGYAAEARSEAVALGAYRLSQPVGRQTLAFDADVVGMAFGPDGSLYVAIAGNSGAQSSLKVFDP